MDSIFGKTGQEEFGMDVNDLEDVGMGPKCPVCGHAMSWLPCPDCSGDGGHDAYEIDPMWYDEGDVVVCGWCNGKGGAWQCWNCFTVKVGSLQGEPAASVEERCDCEDCGPGAELDEDEGQPGLFEEDGIEPGILEGDEDGGCEDDE